MANSYNFPRCNDMSIFYKVNNVKKCSVCAETNQTNRRCCCDLLYKRFPCKGNGLVAPNDFSCSLRQYDACPRISPVRTEQQPQKPVVREIFPVPSEPRPKKCPPRDATFSRTSPRTQPCRQAPPVRQIAAQYPTEERSGRSSPHSEPCHPTCMQPCSQTAPPQQPAVQNPTEHRTDQSSPHSGPCHTACTQPCSQTAPTRQPEILNPIVQRSNQSGPRSGPCIATCMQPCSQTAPPQQPAVQNPTAHRTDQSSPHSGPCTQPCSQTAPTRQPEIQNPIVQRSNQSSPRSGPNITTCRQHCGQTAPARQLAIQNPTTQQSTSGPQQQRPADPEYAQFLLDLTTDIIRNNLNTPREYQVLYNTHVIANKDILNEQKMWDQIELLKNQLDKSRTPDRNNDNQILFDNVEQLPGFECPQNCGATPSTTENAIQEENANDITCGKIIFKLTLDKKQQNEPYVLVDGPLLVPKSLIEKNITTTILKSPYPTSFVQ